MNRKSYSQILDLVAREHVAEQTDLAPHILARIQKGKTMQPRVKMFVTATLILLVLAIVLASVPAVRAAIQHWIGYVPGIGLVSEGQIRVLEEPVSVTQEGITLKVEQVLADSNQTTIIYSVQGLTADMLDSDPTDSLRCNAYAKLRWPEAELQYGREVSGFGANGEGYQNQIYYPALPAAVNEVTLVIPCLPSTLPGKAPESWELTLRLIPAPPELTALPLIEISTPVDEWTTPRSQNDAAHAPHGIFLTLDRAVQMEDGYLIYATLHAENTDFSDVSLISSSSIHLLDVNGREILHYLDIDAMAAMPWEQGKTAIAIKTESIPIPGSITLIIDSVHINMGVKASFTFDPGPNPQPGQVWELNQDVDLGNGYSLRVLRATYPQDASQPGFSFDMESDTGVSAAFLLDLEHPLAEGPGLSGDPFAKSFRDDFYYTGSIPEGPITVTVESISANLPGPWEAQWIPPAPEVQITPTSQYSACTTRQSWEQALQQPEALPAGLTGTLAVQSMVPPNYHAEIEVVRLDGSDRKSLGPGAAPSLSPDGTRVVHVGPMLDGPADGLYITELASGNTVRLPGTIQGDWGPLWSPDGQKIAFTRSPSDDGVGASDPSHIMIIDVDGSNLRQLTEGEGTNFVRAWMPDGHHLLYTGGPDDGAALHIIDVQTGEVRPLPGTNSLSAAISPDGKRLAFHEMLPLDQTGLFVANLDGSDYKLLADGDPYIVTSPVWSPDGNWIIVSVIDPNTTQLSNPRLALIRVADCSVILLPDLSGYASSWIP